MTYDCRYHLVDQNIQLQNVSCRWEQIEERDKPLKDTIVLTGVLYASFKGGKEEQQNRLTASMLLRFQKNWCYYYSHARFKHSMPTMNITIITFYLGFIHLLFTFLLLQLLINYDLIHKSLCKHFMHNFFKIEGKKIFYLLIYYR